MSGKCMTGTCVSHACLCCYDGYDCNKIMLLGFGSCDFLCFRHACCLACNAKDRGCGMVTEESKGEICKIGCFICDFGLIYPTKVCAYASQCLCCFEVGSFPCSKMYVAEPVCAIYFIQCLPECGCCAEPPSCPALDKVSQGEFPDVESMERQ